jgi:methylthioribose-1-phosphate isomerase
VLSFAGRAVAPAGVGARHPAFDVTPARYIAAIVTDEGICRPPYTESLAAAVRDADERRRARAAAPPP